MDKLQETIDSVLNKQNLGNDYLNIIPDVNLSEELCLQFFQCLQMYTIQKCHLINFLESK